MGLSAERLYLAKVIAAKISGALSTVGSGLIIRDVVLRWRRRKAQQTLPIVQRIILGMSIADLFSSCLVHFLGTWMVPKIDVTLSGETFTVPLASGTKTTCNTQAFIWDLFIFAGCCSNATLASAYWLLVCKEKRESELKKWKWQFSLVWLPWLFALTDSLVFVVGFGFYGVDDAWFCGGFVSGDSPHRAWRNGMLAAAAGIINILIILMMSMLLKFVYTLEKKSDTYRSNGECRQKTIQVTMQGIWFVLAYMAAMVPAAVTLVTENYTNSFSLFVACMNPLQGAFNTLVYFRPKYIAERQKMVSSPDRRKSRVSSVLKTLNFPRRLTVPFPPPQNCDNDGSEKSCLEQIIIEPNSKNEKANDNLV